MSVRGVATGALFGAALVGALMAGAWLVELLGETDPPMGSSQRYVVFILPGLIFWLAVAALSPVIWRSARPRRWLLACLAGATVVVVLTGSMGGFVIYGLPILVLVVLTLIPIPERGSPPPKH